MDLFATLIDFILHLDRHLVELLVRYDVWIYAILFLIVFAETGLVVTPFLPGDSLLFAVGALAAIDTSGTLNVHLMAMLLITAAILGNTTNYHVGRWIGPPAFSGKYRLLKVQYLRQAEGYFTKYGASTIVISRFVPILRTVAPFVAGIARMPYLRYQAYSITGAFLWVLLLLYAGYFFGNIPLVRNNFSLVTIGIIIVSLVPVVVTVVKARADAARAAGA
ncbi:MAG: DedA family protein [Proteobacteria bacterium]|nr:DedA family protein [Pseudomonadota bacterium]